MKTIEDLVELFESIPAVGDDRWTVETVIVERMHLSRGVQGQFVIFVEGDQDTFGVMPNWGGLEHSERIVALPGGRILAAMKIRSQDPVHGNRVIAHIAYELCRRLEADSKVNNRSLLNGVSWILPLLGERTEILSAERQYGLVGECLLLMRLINAAVQHEIPGHEVLARWRGAGPSKRDFVAEGIAVEVKNTSHATRLHHFGSIGQLDPQVPGEDVYLFSLAMRRDQSAPKKLPDFFAEVEAGLLSADRGDSDSVLEFRSRLGRYGYAAQYESLYRIEPGFAPPHLPAVFFREADLDRVRIDSFKGDRLPSMVVNVRYDLQVHGVGLQSAEADEVVRRLLRAPAIAIDGD